jgi:NADPH:quinone reductase-like Zn-dependent oxidoreductase
VCSTRNAGLVRSIGTAHVIDYTTEDFTDGRARYDVILDRTYPLTGTAEGLRRVEQGHARGKVVLTVA